jgi:predicted MPP superfamily phosphohydrolase
MPWIVKLILFVVLMLLSEFYFFKRALHSIRIVLPNSPILKYKTIRIIFLSIINFVPVAFICSWIIELLGGPEFNLPTKSNFYDILFYYPFWISMIVILQSVVLILPVDLVRLALSPIKKLDKAKLINLNSKIVIGIVSIFIVYVPIRILIDMTQVSVRETSYESSVINKDLDNLRIGLISDIQADWYNSDGRIQNYIDKLNETNPDIVFIPGDMITHDSESILIAAKLIGKIKSKYGVYACVGDHDNWAYGRDIHKSRKEVIETLANYNARMIDNENLILKIDNSRLGLTFITDTYSERIEYNLLDSLTSSLDSVNLKILVTHQPNGRMKQIAIDKKYNLMLSGHTHGGQITLLFPFLNLTPTLVETKYVKGDFWFSDLMMVVNGGLGVSLAPLRYNSTPEVTLIILRKKNLI